LVSDEHPAVFHVYENSIAGWRECELITGVFGGPGSGKSLYALFLMEQAVKAGRPVYTNIELLPACPFQDKVAQIDTRDWPIVRGEPTVGRSGKVNPDYLAFWHYVLPGAVVVIDEVNIYFDATDHAEFSKDARQFHQQHRKLGIDLIYLCQNLPNMWVRIRRLTGRFILCEWNYRTSRIFNHLPITWSRFLRGEYGDEQFRDERAVGYFSYREAARMFSWYRTEQILGDTTYFRQAVTNGNAYSGSAAGAAGSGSAIERGSASGLGTETPDLAGLVASGGGVLRGLQGLSALPFAGGLGGFSSPAEQLVIRAAAG
jgi:hypothetical protein